MSTHLDWLSVIKRREPDFAGSIGQSITEADRAFSQWKIKSTADEDLRKVELDLLSDQCGHLSVWMRAYASVLQRRLVLALHADKPVDECFNLFETLSRVGFASPVDKSRIVILVLQYLEGKTKRSDLSPLVEAMVEELMTCRVGCDENLVTLRAF